MWTWKLISRQVEQTWELPHVLGTGLGEERGEESPRSAGWPGVLVDQSWRTLMGLDFVCVKGQSTRTAHVPGAWDSCGWTELQISIPLTGLLKSRLENLCTAGHEDGGLIRERSKGKCDREEYCGSILQKRNDPVRTPKNKATLLTGK